MTNGQVRISELPEMAAISDDNIFIIENESNTCKISLENILHYMKTHKDFLDYYIRKSNIGEKNGIAPLDADKKVPNNYLKFGTTTGSIYDGALGKALSDTLNELILNTCNIDNTSDINKPVSVLQQTAIDIAYANSNAYTDQKIADLINGAPSTLDTLKEIADAMSDNQNVIDVLNESVGLKANQTELDTHINNNAIHITASERNKIHTHGNFAVLNSITSELIEKWNNSVAKQNEVLSDSEPSNQNINDYWLLEYE